MLSICFFLQLHRLITLILTQNSLDATEDVALNFGDEEEAMKGKKFR